MSNEKKLSDTVELLNFLDNINIHPDRVEAIRNIAGVFHDVTNHKCQIDQYSQRLQDNFKEIKTGFDHFLETLLELKQELEQEVNSRENEYLQNSLRLYQHEMIYESPQYILNRRLAAADSDLEYLISRIKLLSDWRYPGLCIRPGLEEFVKFLVPLDPLYLVDQHQDLLTPSVSEFNQAYQHRLRQYIINDYSSTPILDQLPDNQFALVFAYNFFNYKPMSVIERYLNEIFTKLRPGGTTLLTYNNCERSHGVGLAEKNFMTYVTKTMIETCVLQIGFEIVSHINGNGDITILEIKKPGELSTIRGGQTLAEILADS